MSAAGPLNRAGLQAASGGSEPAFRASVGVHPLALVRLLQLASPTLPIGAYSYSQGLEWAVEAGTVHDAASAQTWIGDLMDYAIGPGEAAILWRCLQAVSANDVAAFVGWNAWFRASRETSELRAETEQTGAALIKWLEDLELLDASANAMVDAATPVTLPAAYALAAHASGVEAQPALTAYVWSWLENQVLAAMKAIPLGQAAGQRMSRSLASRIPAVIEATQVLDDADVASFAPGLALASARHETQYTRLFRS